jgi:hypothetical protein
LDSGLRQNGRNEKKESRYPPIINIHTSEGWYPSKDNQLSSIKTLDSGLNPEWNEHNEIN